MSVIILLIIFSMLVAGGFLFAFIWAVKNGQYDDQYTPSIRILFDSGKKNNSKEKLKSKPPFSQNRKMQPL